MEILQILWVPENAAKIRLHGIEPDEVEDLVDRDTYVVDEHPDYTDQVRIIGHTRTGRWLTISMQDLGGGLYRPVTGWIASQEEVRRFFEAV